jgi:uncharacterized protein YkwD
MRRVRIVLVVGIMLTWLAQTAYANTTASWCASPREVALLGLINDLRAEKGLVPLAMSQSLGAAAEHHSRDMARNDYFSHTLSDGTSWSQNMTNHGYTYTTYRGENLAAGERTEGGTFTAWFNSPGHYSVMTGSHYRVVGIGLAYNADSTYGWYWTADFGGRIDAAATVC